jgi:hypothetical protein
VVGIGENFLSRRRIRIIESRTNVSWASCLGPFDVARAAEPDARCHVWPPSIRPSGN